MSFEFEHAPCTVGEGFRAVGGRWRLMFGRYGKSESIIVGQHELDSTPDAFDPGVDGRARRPRVLGVSVRDQCFWRLLDEPPDSGIQRVGDLSQFKRGDSAAAQLDLGQRGSIE